MRLTSVDIHSREFARCFRGYSGREVEAFRQEVADNFEELQVEVAAARDEVARVRDELEHYRALERSMNESLMLAQRSADEVKANAHKEAELIVRNAEQQARDVLQQARAERTVLERGIAELRQARAQCLDEFGALIAAVTQRLEGFRSRVEEAQQAAGEDSGRLRDTIPSWLSEDRGQPTAAGS